MQAITFNEQARDLSQQFGFTELLGLAVMNMGASYLKLDNLPESEAHLMQALDMFQAIANEANIPEAQRHLAELRLKQGRPNEALELAQIALTGAKQAENQLEIGHTYRVLG